MDPMSSRISLSDGRFLGYAETGDPDGRPILYFHGWPGSRLEAQLLDPAAKHVGVRVIAADRPGMGLSEFKGGRTIADWSQDVSELADKVGISRFAILGFSGGGPYAVACVQALHPRLTAAMIVGGLGPLGEPGATSGMNRGNRLVFFLARTAPWVLRVFMELTASGLRRDPHRVLSQMSAALPKPDRDVLSEPRVRELLIASFREAFRQGARGVVAEAVLYSRPWGFSLRDIQIPFHVWQGEMDTNVPPSMATYLATAIPTSEARYFSSEGHFSLGENHMADILEVLVGAEH